MGALAPGLAAASCLGMGALWLGRLEAVRGVVLSPLTLAILGGMVLGNTVYPRWEARWGRGVQWAQRTLLRLGVALFGFRLTLGDVAAVGWRGAVTDLLVVGSTLLLACVAGRFLRMDRRTVLLVGMGSSVCGAAAVMAAEETVRGGPDRVAVAVSTVVVFGTLALFLYPLLYPLGIAWGLWGTDGLGYGLYVGSTVHEVAQVVAAGRAVSPEAAGFAVIVKMIRVMLLVPLVPLLARLLPEAGEKGRAAVPRFVLGFAGMVGLHSLGWVPERGVAAILLAGDLFLATAMAALGLCARVESVRRAGLKPLILAGILFLWLLVGGGAINGAAGLLADGAALRLVW